MNRVVRGAAVSLLVALVLCAVAALALIVQARGTPSGVPTYVALGSSYAAGAGLSPPAPGSPLLCARSAAGYPSLLARRLRLPLVDMSCGGARTSHLLHGGQFFQGPQLRAIDARTRLVTITAGGNDVGLVGDLSLLAMRNAGGVGGWLVARLWPGPATQRDFDAGRTSLEATIDAIRARAPHARIVIASYPRILPAAGTCTALRITAADAGRMRPVEQRLAAVTREAAVRSGVVYVDMNAIGAAHHACSAQPWVHGWSALLKAPFHATHAGAVATADAIAAALRALPAGIAAVGEYDAPRHQAGRVRREEQDDAGDLLRRS